MSKPSLLEVRGGLQRAGRRGHPGDLPGPAELNPSVLGNEAFWPKQGGVAQEAAARSGVAVGRNLVGESTWPEGVEEMITRCF